MTDRAQTDRAKTYRVALLGAGETARRHAQAWAALPQAEVAGPAYADWDRLWATGFQADARPDIVDLCGPVSERRRGAEQAIAAGCAVFCEGLPAPDADGCAALADAAARAGVAAMSGLNLRFHPEFAAAKRLVEAGGVGQPAAIRTARTAGFPEGGGRLVPDLLAPDLDWLRETFGPVRRVFAKSVNREAGGAGTVDYALATLRFESGAVAHVTGAWTASGASRTMLEIAGDGGLIEYDSARCVPLALSSFAGGEARTESPLAPAEDPDIQAFDAFLQALAASRPPPTTFADAREAARLVQAVQESIQTGKVVLL